VGPRPEVRRYVDYYSPEQVKVLSVRPGITDYASLEYIDENIILEKSINPDETYINEILPAKIELNMRYINHSTVGEYFKVIFLTVFKIIR
jgi:lipopolysaccharide/colanic/teichoic acid biosynthesis glycosyltransferase